MFVGSFGVGKKKEKIKLLRRRLSPVRTSSINILTTTNVIKDLF
jgi:hypothetical protein